MALTEQQVKQAEELLRQTALSVEQIADSLGYAETASFTHAFKRWTGRPPSRFRQVAGGSPQRGHGFPLTGRIDG